MSIDAKMIAHPIIRGFWTDEEMMAITGATSLAPIKRLQKAGVISPGRYEKAPGKKARAWSLNEVLTIALALNFAEQASVNLSVTSVILSAISSRTINRVTLGDQIMQEAVRELSVVSQDVGQDEWGLPLTWHNHVLTVSRRTCLDLIVIDRKDVLIREKRTDSSGSRNERFIASFESMKSNEPSYSLLNTKRILSVGQSTEISRLVVHLHRLLNTSLLSEAVGANVHVVEPYLEVEE